MSTRYQRLAVATEQWAKMQPKYHYEPALRPAPEALLSEQDGWAIYTSNFSLLDANMLVHLSCNRHFPNWWMAPYIQGGAAQDPELECPDCKVKLPLHMYHIFWGAYRLLNMTKHPKT